MSYGIQRHIVSSVFGDLNSRSVVVVKGGGAFPLLQFLTRRYKEYCNLVGTM